MDKIIIKDLRIYAYHGVNDFEKQRGQTFILDVEISADLTKACETDNLEDTINYSQAVNIIKDTMIARSYDLIERAAQVTADALLDGLPLAESVHIVLKKPKAPIRADFGYAAVEIFRSR